MSKIQWTDETWNPVVGCSPVSEGCRNCYAAKEAIRLAGHPNPKVSDEYRGTSEMRGTGATRRAVFTGVVNTVPRRLEQPLRWTRPRRVFVNSMSDLFHEDVPFEYIDRVFGVMAIAKTHTFQVLTKRPERMAEYLSVADLGARLFHGALQVKGSDPGPSPGFPLRNVWLGTSVEDQDAADERIPHLMRTLAAVRFLSCEPLLGPVDLSRWTWRPTHCHDCCTTHDDRRPSCCGRATTVNGPFGESPSPQNLHWVIVGGESGPGARPCSLGWIEDLVVDCHEAGVACFVKQLGADPRKVDHLPERPGRRYEISDRKGGDPDEWPEHLRVRQFPTTHEG